MTLAWEGMQGCWITLGCSQKGDDLPYFKFLPAKPLRFGDQSIQFYFKERGMNWQQVCEDPNFKDLPYRVELNQNGKIIMSPAKNEHALYQGRIERILWKYTENGEVYPECPIETSDGTKAADVVWMSEERIEITKKEVSCSIAPEICIEVLSSTNTKKEMEVLVDFLLQ